jgi:hypothetical protein
LKLDRLRIDSKLETPVLLELGEILVRVVLEVVLELVPREGADPKLADADHCRVGVADQKAVPIPLVALSYVETDKVPEQRIDVEEGVGQDALVVGRITKCLETGAIGTGRSTLG